MKAISSSLWDYEFNDERDYHRLVLWRNRWQEGDKNIRFLAQESIVTAWFGSVWLRLK